MKYQRPCDRHEDDQMRLAYYKWWRELSRQGDPAYQPHLVERAFLAGWLAAMADVKEAELFLAKIREEERRESARWSPRFDDPGMNR